MVLNWPNALQCTRSHAVPENLERLIDDHYDEDPHFISGVGRMANRRQGDCEHLSHRVALDGKRNEPNGLLTRFPPSFDTTKWRMLITIRLHIFVQG